MNTTDYTQEHFMSVDEEIRHEVLRGRLALLAPLPENVSAVVSLMKKVNLGGVASDTFHPKIHILEKPAIAVDAKAQQDADKVMQVGDYGLLSSDPIINQDAYTKEVLKLDPIDKPVTPTADEAAARDVISAIFAEEGLGYDDTYISEGTTELERYASSQESELV